MDADITIRLAAAHPNPSTVNEDELDLASYLLAILFDNSSSLITNPSSLIAYRRGEGKGGEGNKKFDLRQDRADTEAVLLTNGHFYEEADSSAYSGAYAGSGADA